MFVFLNNFISLNLYPAFFIFKKYKSFLIDIGYDGGDDDERTFQIDLDKVVKAKDYKKDMENIKGLLNRLKGIFRWFNKNFRILMLKFY
jgi:hypothetical protein